jgi:hypothetical protein
MGLALHLDLALGMCQQARQDPFSRQMICQLIPLIGEARGTPGKRRRQVRLGIREDVYLRHPIVGEEPSGNAVRGKPDMPHEHARVRTAPKLWEFDLDGFRFNEFASIY